MEIPSSGWIPHMVMNSLGDDDDLDFNSFHSESFSSYSYQQPSNDIHIPPTQTQASSPYERPPEKQLKRHASTPPRTSPPPSSSSPQIISFGKTTSSSSSSLSDHKNIMPKQEDCGYGFSYVASQGENGYGMVHPPKHSQIYNACGPYYSKSSSRTPLYAQEHVIAERKRRERLNQRIIALSAIVPGLTKMDKASVLEDATKYLKQLQERVKTLEEEVSKKTSSELVIKKSWLVDEEISSSSDENSCNQSNHNLPEIEARVSDKFILLKIQCLNRKGCLSKILEEVEKYNLCVLSTSVLPFGSSILDITILAQMDEEFSMKFEDLVKNLRRALLSII